MAKNLFHVDIFLLTEWSVCLYYECVVVCLMSTNGHVTKHDRMTILVTLLMLIRIYYPVTAADSSTLRPSATGTSPGDGGRTQPLFCPHNLIYLHPLPALRRGPFVSQLRQGSGHPLVHGRTGGLAGEHGARRLQLLHPRLGQPLVAPDRDEGVRLGRRPRHPSASREAVGGG